MMFPYRLMKDDVSTDANASQLLLRHAIAGRADAVATHYQPARCAFNELPSTSAKGSASIVTFAS